MLPAIADAYNVQIIYENTVTGVRTENVINCQSSTLDAASIWMAVLSTWGTNIMPLLSNQISIVHGRVEQWSSTPDVHDQDHTQVGGVAQHAVSPQVAFLSKLTTGVAGRRYRGRSYLPGMPVTALVTTDQSQWAAGEVTAVEDAYLAVMSDMATADCRMVIASRAGAIATTVTGVTGRQTVATQRRRVT